MFACPMQPCCFQLLIASAYLRSYFAYIFLEALELPGRLQTDSVDTALGKNLCAYSITHARQICYVPAYATSVIKKTVL